MSSFSDLPSLLPFHLAYFSAEQLRNVFQHFGSLKQALQASQGELRASGLVKDKQIDALFAADLTQRVDEALAWAEQENQSLLGLGAMGFPEQLNEISDAPILLYVKGSVSLLSDPQLAIVGSRHASKLGTSSAKDFAHYLSDQGLGITSGLALGIDTAAHQGGLLGIGKTIAVVATGLDRIYPARNKELGHEIVEQGAMVSEFPLGTKPLAHHFPKRNRIISGLSVGTLVVEAALKSGSLITARMALEQGREVFAIPGSINNPQAKGCHQLIKQGAKLVESGQDVLEELVGLIELTKTKPMNQQDWLQETERGSNASPSSTVEASRILNYLAYEPMGLDELVVLSKMPVSDILSQMMLLELSGEVEAMSAGRWRRIK
ncbi:MAG: DNA-processing protein DprA [Thiotrichales bacterium]|nr:DNA-processing protein DprA [Thiotrichales bacterium]